MPARPIPVRSRAELTAAIEEYFSALELATDFPVRYVLGFLDSMTAEGASREGLESAWTDLELFVAYLEVLDTSRRLEELEPWEFSRFVFEFLEKEVYDPEARLASRKRQLLATIVALFEYLVRVSELGTASPIEEAFRKIFSGKKPKKLPRPPMQAGDLLGWMNGPTTGVSHELRAADLWLALVRDSDFDGEWKALIEHLETHTIPGAEPKADAARRLASIQSQDMLDPTELLGTEERDKLLVERARRYFYTEDAPDRAAGKAAKPD